MDWPIDDFDGDPVDQTPAERELVPEGTHLFTIKKIEEDSVGLKIALAHDDTGREWVWGNFPRHEPWARKIVSGLPPALGLTVEAWNAAAPDDLWGHQVMAKVYHRQGRDKTFVNIASFSRPEPAEKPVAKPAAKRAQTAKAAAAMAESGGEDHIPF
jgi:hypothetical protein